MLRKQANTQINKQKNKQANTQASKQTHQQRSKQTNKQTNKQANKQASKQANKQRSTQANAYRLHRSPEGAFRYGLVPPGGLDGTRMGLRWAKMRLRKIEGHQKGGQEAPQEGPRGPKRRNKSLSHRDQRMKDP